MDLTPETIASIDSERMAEDILAMPDHLRDALWRVESANLEPEDAPGGLVVAGMGGSAIGGTLARAALGDRASRSIVIARSYALPAWTTPDTLVLCASYSGNTEETLAIYEAAGAVGARRIVATTGGKLAEAARAEDVPVIPLPGGFQPRAAVAYSLVVALEVAWLCGAGERLHAEIDVAAAHLEQIASMWGPDAPEDSLAKQLARGLHGTIPQIAGSGLTSPIAYRWKTQINENAKTPCFAHELPELDHNEIVGWQGASQLGSLQRGIPRRLRPAPPDPPANRADPRADRGRRCRHVPGREHRPEPHRAPDLARPAGRPGVALSRRAARGRSDAGAGDRAR